jgi:hypothetical protein
MTIVYNYNPNTPATKAFSTGTECYKVCAATESVADAGRPDAWWKLNETAGGLATDSALAHRHGYLYGGVSWSDSGAAFDATGDIYTTAPIVAPRVSPSRRG